jgi:hypothetical protein
VKTAAHDEDVAAARDLARRAHAAAGNPEDSPENRRLILHALIDLAAAEFKADGERLIEALKPFEDDGEASEKSFLKGAADVIFGWKQKVARGIRRLFLAGALILAGGPEGALTREDIGDVDTALIDQTKRLTRFAQQIQDGEQELDGSLPAREALYASSTWQAAWKVEAGRAVREARTTEQWMLGDAERHCPDCPALADLGPVPLGTLPAIGSQTCSYGCRCHIEYS